ncbi:uncharacterized protein ACA1_293160 [Acanthamoeba castellanii str. Neff]|uniref:Uncharacterized protein n=1 Tax=Acanthamoeba castellanii (strain ATCC 30010 / Neff) TaxID=1257118 RepID=L8HJM0_ACACF|nr:uncharacterized protein ACA1_293160 [Acanthamoeba castellanii str. Neff]ELR25405.1 hypothetical protein ACA1_293160 [Acanthamoeba castellanii str. Neff]
MKNTHEVVVVVQVGDGREGHQGGRRPGRPGEVVPGGFQPLSENLLSCAHPGLYSLPGTWIQHLLKVIENDDFKSITRRSAGLPYCFCAILRAETIVLGRRRGGVKVLIAQAMQALLRIASGGDTRQLETQDAKSEGVESVIGEQAHQVHALNTNKANKKVKPGEGSRPQLSPEAFIPLCSANSNFKVREMAARALVPLVPPEHVAAFIASLFASHPRPRRASQVKGLELISIFCGLFNPSRALGPLPARLPAPAHQAHAGRLQEREASGVGRLDRLRAAGARHFAPSQVEFAAIRVTLHTADGDARTTELS